MRTAAGLALVKVSEGLVLRAAPDGVGIPTVGYGHTNAAGPPPVTMGMIVTEAWSETVLNGDLVICDAQLSLVLKAVLNDNEHDAILDFLFNLGIANLERSTLLRRINAGDFDLSWRNADGNDVGEFGRWIYDEDGEIEPGLIKRRAAEYKLWQTPVKATTDV